MAIAGLLWVAGNAAASPAARPLAQGGAPLLLNYQGRLADPSTSLPKPDGVYTINFSLYNSQGAASATWSETQTVTVTRGLFNVLLGSSQALSATLFDGTNRWLGLKVEGETLDPRVRIASVPYAIQAEEAKNADTVDGEDANAFADAVHSHDDDYVNEGQADSISSTMILTGNVTAVEIADGATLAEILDDDGAGSGLDADMVDGLHASTLITHYQNVIVVAKSGGDHTSINAALASVAGPGPGNTYLIWVAPGIYTETVRMMPYVDIEGAGELATKITHPGFSTAYAGTVEGADHAELRFLTVENTGGDSFAVGIYNNGTSPHLTRVRASASGASTGNYGVHNYWPCAPLMTDVTASAWGGDVCVGVYNHDNASPIMRDVTASASEGDHTYGVYNHENASPTMRGVAASASSGMVCAGVYNHLSSAPMMKDVTASASLGGTNYGVRNECASPTMTDIIASASGGGHSYGVGNADCSPTLTNVTARASGAAVDNAGVKNDHASPTIQNSVLGGGGGAGVCCGLYNIAASPTVRNSVVEGSGGPVNNGIYNTATSGTYTVTLSNCQIVGSSNTVNNSSTFVTLVGASLMDGGPVVGGGTVVCTHVHDETYAPWTGVCPP
jgi:hypothetical protein